MIRTYLTYICVLDKKVCARLDKIITAEKTFTCALLASFLSDGNREGWTRFLNLTTPSRNLSILDQQNLRLPRVKMTHNVFLLSIDVHSREELHKILIQSSKFWTFGRYLKRQKVQGVHTWQNLSFQGRVRHTTWTKFFRKLIYPLWFLLIAVSQDIILWLFLCILPVVSPIFRPKKKTFLWQATCPPIPTPT